MDWPKGQPKPCCSVTRPVVSRPAPCCAVSSRAVPRCADASDRRCGSGQHPWHCGHAGSHGSGGGQAHSHLPVNPTAGTHRAGGLWCQLSGGSSTGPLQQLWMPLVLQDSQSCRVAWLALPGWFTQNGTMTLQSHRIEADSAVLLCVCCAVCHCGNFGHRVCIRRPGAHTGRWCNCAPPNHGSCCQSMRAAARHALPS